MRSNVKNIVIAGVVFVLLAVIGIVIDRSSSDDAAGPKPLVDPDKAEVFDDFNRADGAGLRTAKKARWSTVGGGWRIEDGAAAAAANADRVAIATVDTEGGDGVVQAAMSAVTNGGGIVFRFRDARNYWALTAAPAYATWNVEKVVNGDSTMVGNTGLSPVAPGTVASVRLTGATLEVLFNGKVAKQFTDATFSDATRAGLIAKTQQSAGARWDRFAADGRKAGGGSRPTTTLAPTTTTEPTTTTTTTAPATTTTAGRR